MKRVNLILLLLALLCAVCAFVGCGGEPYDTSDSSSSNSNKYDLSDECFIFESYNVVKKGPTESGENFSVFSANILEIYGRCITSADELNAYVELYDNKGERLANYRLSETGDVDKNEQFVLRVDISDETAEKFCVVKVRYEGVAIKRVYRVEELFRNVTFVYNNDEPSKMIVVKKGTKLEFPAVPQRDGYIFTAWYTDPSCTEMFDFESMKISDDLELYAGYMLDYLVMSNRVSEISNESIVKIRTKSYSSVLWGMVEVTSHEKEGEGVIIEDNAGYYYVLTTNDLVEKRKGYESVSYTVTDHFGNEYSATLKHSGVTYNLGVLYFEKNSDFPIDVVELSDKTPSLNDDIASVTLLNGIYYPHFGKVLGFEIIKHKNSGSNANDNNYEMMVHNSRADREVTGRPVFDMNLKLVGIQCGTLTNDEVSFENPHVIPWSVIKKYIDAYGL